MPHPQHRFYRVLFAVCLLVMASLALPGRWNRLASPGYLLLALTMIVGLGRPQTSESLASPTRHLYRGLGLLTVAAGLLWSLTPVESRDSGRCSASGAACGWCAAWRRSSGSASR
jgi:hypothetical protein